MRKADGVVIWLHGHVVVWLTVLTLVVLGAISAGVVVSLKAADSAARSAQVAAVQEATARAARQRCRTSLGLLRAFNTHLSGVNELAETLVQNTWVSRNSVPRSDPQWKVRNANLTRIKAARKAIGAVTSFPLPRC